MKKTRLQEIYDEEPATLHLKVFDLNCFTGDVEALLKKKKIYSDEKVYTIHVNTTPGIWRFWKTHKTVEFEVKRNMEEIDNFLGIMKNPLIRDVLFRMKIKSVQINLKK